MGGAISLQNHSRLGCKPSLLLQRPRGTVEEPGDAVHLSPGNPTCGERAPPWSHRLWFLEGRPEHTWPLPSRKAPVAGSLLVGQGFPGSGGGTRAKLSMAGKAEGEGGLSVKASDLPTSVLFGCVTYVMSPRSSVVRPLNTPLKRNGEIH